MYKRLCLAGVGLDEKEAEAQGIPFQVMSLHVEEIQRAAVALDTRGFVKLIREITIKLLGREQLLLKMVNYL